MREVSDHFEALSTIQLQDASAGRQIKVTESAKICWLLASMRVEEDVSAPFAILA